MPKNKPSSKPAQVTSSKPNDPAEKTRDAAGVAYDPPTLTMTTVLPTPAEWDQFASLAQQCADDMTDLDADELTIPELARLIRDLCGHDVTKFLIRFCDVVNKLPE